MDDLEQKDEVLDEAKPEDVEQDQTQQPPVPEDKKDDRPEVNYKAELARKNEELRRLREDVEALKSRTTRAADPNDISTWPDLELKALAASPAPEHVVMREKAQDILLERKLEARERRRNEEIVRTKTEEERYAKYPETFDEAHPMHQKMQQVMRELQLDHSPAGRLAAAKIAASEFKAKSLEERGRKKEQERVADVKANYTGGDRPAPVANPSSQKKIDELQARVAQGDNAAWLELCRIRGLGLKK
jgi:hypothetical protein